MVRTTLALLLAVGLLAGCADSGTATTSPSTPAPGSSSTPAPASTPNPGPTPTSAAPAALILMLERTGGFVGVDQAITIAGDGSWTYVDKQTGATSTGRFNPSQRSQFVGLAQDPRLAQDLGQPSEVVCNDGFEYALIMGTLSGTFEDCGSMRPAVEALLTFVMDATDF